MYNTCFTSGVESGDSQCSSGTFTLTSSIGIIKLFPSELRTTPFAGSSTYIERHKSVMLVQRIDEEVDDPF